MSSACTCLWARLDTRAQNSMTLLPLIVIPRPHDQDDGRYVLVLFSQTLVLYSSVALISSRVTHLLAPLVSSPSSFPPFTSVYPALSSLLRSPADRPLLLFLCFCSLLPRAHGAPITRTMAHQRKNQQPRISFHTLMPRCVSLCMCVLFDNCLHSSCNCSLWIQHRPILFPKSPRNKCVTHYFLVLLS